MTLSVEPLYAPAATQLSPRAQIQRMVKITPRHHPPSQPHQRIGTQIKIRGLGRDLNAQQNPPSFPPQPHPPTAIPILPGPRPSPHTVTVVTYEAFREITNFIRNNGDDWNKFCTNTTRTARKPTIPTHSPNSISKHKIDKNNGRLAPEPLL